MKSPDHRLPRSFFARPVHDVARDLLGRHVTFGGVRLRVTETEAYAGSVDPGSHAYRGITPRTRPMFGAAGVTYVYFTYGNHWMLCLVTGQPGTAEAVLIRAAEVIEGHDEVFVRRGDVAPRDRARGPGRLAKALGLGAEHTGRDFCVPTLGPDAADDLGTVAAPIDLVVTHGEPVPDDVVRTGPRVGVSGPGGDAENFPWRYWIDGDPTVSVYRPGVIRKRR